MTKTRILIADDHAIVRDGVKALLSLADDLEVVGEAAGGQEAIDLAAECGAARLVLFHHDPRRTDAEMDDLLVAAREYAATRAPSLELLAAHEGQSLTF